jgi:hypothetical protein
VGNRYPAAELPSPKKLLKGPLDEMPQTSTAQLSRETASRLHTSLGGYKNAPRSEQDRDRKSHQDRPSAAELAVYNSSTSIYALAMDKVT